MPEGGLSEPTEDGWSVLRVARRLGWTKKRTRRRLQFLHRSHGGLLFQETDSPNAKRWVDMARLAVLWPEEFAPVPPTAADVQTLLRRTERAEEAAAKALEEVERLRLELAEQGRAKLW